MEWYMSKYGPYYAICKHVQILNYSIRLIAFFIYLFFLVYFHPKSLHSVFGVFVIKEDN